LKFEIAYIKEITVTQNPDIYIFLFHAYYYLTILF